MKIVKAEREEKNIIEAARVVFPHLQGVSDVEILKAIKLAKAMGLDPIRKECHLVPFKGTVQVVVNYLEYVKCAEHSGYLEGWNVQIGQDEFGMYAETEIFRKDWRNSFKWRTYLNEVKKETQNWKVMPIFMLKKVCIAQAFRLCFPNCFSFSEETVLIEEDIVEPELELVDETTTEAVKETSESKEGRITEAQRKRLWAIANNTAKKHGLSSEIVETVIRSVLAEYKLQHTKDILRDDYDAIVEKIIKEIEEIAKEGDKE